MTENETRALIEKLGPWFHQIELGNGVFTKTRPLAAEPLNHPVPTWESVEQCLPTDLSGKSVLDVGCNAGFYSVEAKRRGASRVVGVDALRMFVRQAHFVNRALGLDIEFHRVSAYQLDATTFGTFDITLALGLIYHMKHPVLALEKLWRLTNERMIIETAVFPPHRTHAPFQHPAYGDRSVHTLGFIENRPEGTEAHANWFLPGVDALLGMLRQIGVKAPAVFEVKGERAIVVCDKQPQQRLTIAPAAHDGKLVMATSKSTCGPNHPLTLRVGAKNIGRCQWLMGSVRLGAHLLSEHGEELEWDFGRCDLSRDVGVGEEEVFEIQLMTPATPARYIVELDMLIETVAWFEDLESAGSIRHTVDVR